MVDEVHHPGGIGGGGTNPGSSPGGFRPSQNGLCDVACHRRRTDARGSILYNGRGTAEKYFRSPPGRMTGAPECLVQPEGFRLRRLPAASPCRLPQRQLDGGAPAIDPLQGCGRC